MDFPLDTAPCPKCHGKGYTMHVMPHPKKMLQYKSKICGCINKNLPIPEIKDGKLNFILN
jgi:hypothetical protein